MGVHRKDPNKLSVYMELGTRFGELELVAYVHSNGKISLDQELDRELYLHSYVKYKVHCHRCGNHKLMDEVNVRRHTTCGCSRPFHGTNFNWEGKSKHL
jgi:hypothetical protein